jgi:hypothetical protein
MIFSWQTRMTNFFGRRRKKKKKKKKFVLCELMIFFWLFFHILSTSESNHAVDGAAAALCEALARSAREVFGCSAGRGDDVALHPRTAEPVAWPRGGLGNLLVKVVQVRLEHRAQSVSFARPSGDMGAMWWW